MKQTQKHLSPSIRTSRKCAQGILSLNLSSVVSEVTFLVWLSRAVTIPPVWCHLTSCVNVHESYGRNYASLKSVLMQLQVYHYLFVIHGQIVCMIKFLSALKKHRVCLLYETRERRSISLLRCHR